MPLCIECNISQLAAAAPLGGPYPGDLIFDNILSNLGSKSLFKFNDGGLQGTNCSHYVSNHLSAYRASQKKT